MTVSTRVMLACAHMVMLVVCCWDPFWSITPLFWLVSVYAWLSVPVVNILNLFFAWNHHFFYTSTWVQTLICNLPNILIAVTQETWTQYVPERAQELYFLFCLGAPACSLVPPPPQLCTSQMWALSQTHLPAFPLSSSWSLALSALPSDISEYRPPPPSSLPEGPSLCLPANPFSKPPQIFFLNNLHFNISAKNPQMDA